VAQRRYRDAIVRSGTAVVAAALLMGAAIGCQNDAANDGTATAPTAGAGPVAASATPLPLPETLTPEQRAGAERMERAKAEGRAGAR